MSLISALAERCSSFGSVFTLPRLLLLLGSLFVPFTTAADAQEVAMLRNPATVVSPRVPAAPAGEVTLARLEARRPAAAARPLGPFILLSHQLDLVRNRAEVEEEQQQRHQRRIAARYSVMSWNNIPVPNSLHEVTLAEKESAPFIPGVDRWADSAVDGGGSLGGSPMDLDAGFFHEDLVARVERPLSLRERGLQRLARRITFRNARKYMRSRLKDEFEAHPAYDFADYQRDREAIWSIGREDSRNDNDAFEEFRRGVLADDPDEVEREINLVEWGPLQIDDQGGLSINVKRLFRRSEAPPTVELSAAKEEPPEGESLFSGRSYALDTDLRFTPHVNDLASGDFREFFGKIKASVELDFRDPILLDTYLSTELEAQFNPNGDMALFLNFVLQ